MSARDKFYKIGVIDLMSTIQPTDRLLQQLEALTHEEIDLVIAFVGFLHHRKSIQQSIQPPIQSQSQAKKDAEPTALSQFWKQWFAEVEQLEVSLTEPSSEYEESLLAKYRQQGLEL
jgi:hypothetical protein